MPVPELEISPRMDSCLLMPLWLLDRSLAEPRTLRLTEGGSGLHYLPFYHTIFSSIIFTHSIFLKLLSFFLNYFLVLHITDLFFWTLVSICYINGIQNWLFSCLFPCSYLVSFLIFVALCFKSLSSYSFLILLCTSCFFHLSKLFSLQNLLPEPELLLRFYNMLRVLCSGSLIFHCMSFFFSFTVVRKDLPHCFLTWVTLVFLYACRFWFNVLFMKRS